MGSLRRLLPSGALLVGLLAFLLLQQATVSPILAVQYTGIARTDNGILSLELKIDPPVAQPGDTVQLSATLYNSGQTTAAPMVRLLLPARINPDSGVLPAGATVNLQSNTINWLPVLSPGDQQTFTIPLQVSTADINQPEQRVQAVLVQDGLEHSATATIWIGILPFIQSVSPPLQVSVGQPIILEAEVAGSPPYQYAWYLGDGRRVDVARPVVVFPAAGQYEITLEVTNPLGRTSHSVPVTVVPVPVANFVPDDPSPGIGQPVVFENASGGQPPLSVTWDFGDGTELSGEMRPVHAYDVPGNYEVQLVIENAFGRSEAFTTIEVGVPPVADLVIPTSVAVGLPLQGQALGDDTVTSYRWDMGDGRTHEGEQISHIYQRPGDYYVTLFAGNGFAETQAGRWVHVDPGISSLFLSFVIQDDSAPVEASADSPPADGSDIPLEPVELESEFVLPPVQLPAGATAAEQLFIYINEARRLFELPALGYTQELSAAAQYHSRDKAYYPDSPHVGTDGTTSAERLMRHGYAGGYAGEATAWGFADPREAVEFWVNSDPHRGIILNRYATDVGVGYAEDYATRNIWHWTAEFGNRYGSPVEAVLRLQEPASGMRALNTDIVNYGWSWPLPLASDQQFIVYLQRGDRQLRLGRINQPVYGSRFVLSAVVDDAETPLALNPFSSANYDWFVRLEDGRGAILAESERRSISFRPDPNVTITPTVTATITSTVAPLVTATPALVTPEASSTPAPPATPVLPTTPVDLPPPIVTATPRPSPEP
jgi:uncharacterized protein YkwD/PKD repeat protein